MDKPGDQSAQLLEFTAVAVDTTRSLDSFSGALEAALAPFEAERAAAHFEGRVPPSLEVFAAEETR